MKIIWSTSWVSSHSVSFSYRFSKIIGRRQNSNVQHYVFPSRHYRHLTTVGLESVHFAREQKKTKRRELRSSAITTKYDQFIIIHSIVEFK